MAINPVSSGTSSQAIRPQPQADQTRQAELTKQAALAKQAKQAEQTQQATKAPPVVNGQGQTTGSIINTTA